MGVGLEARAASADVPEREFSFIELTYDVAIGCSTRGEFIELVRGRQPSGMSVDTSRRVAVVVRIDAHGYTGRITSQEGERAHLLRDVSAGSCREVADAFAFIVDVAADSSTTAAPPAPSEDQQL